MKTAIQIFLKQTQRGTKRLILQLVLLCAAVTFFVVSLNLYSNSTKNLQAVEDSYTTIVAMEFYGNINRKGELVAPDAADRLGYRLVSVDNYDFSPILDLDCVTGIDLRTRLGAYIPGEAHIEHITTPEDMLIPENLIRFFESQDVIRFTIDSDQSVEIPLAVVPDDDPTGVTHITLPIRILSQNRSDIQYPDTIILSIPTLFEKQLPSLEDDIRRLNQNNRTDAIILQPTVEYVMNGNIGGYFQWDETVDRYVWKYSDSPGIGALTFSPSTYLYYQPGKVAYHTMGSSVDIDPAPLNTTYGLQRYADVKNDPEWLKNAQCAEYSTYSFTVTTTNDMQGIPAWYKGGMYLQSGRMIAEEEYDSGAKVCMVSAQMAEYQGWQVGDELDLHLFEFTGYCEQADATYSLTAPWYYRELDGFFEEDTYEIVGIFGQREFTDFGDTAEEVFYSPWNAIYIPANAAPDAPEGPIQPSLLTIHLKNGSINEFKAAVEEMGLTEQKPGEYELRFSYFDQGYDKIKGSLDEMNRNATLLLGLSAVLLVVTMVLMVFLFSRQHKHSTGILRMLGGSKKQAFTAILACAAAVVAAGGIVGTILGGALTQSVGASILGDAVDSAAVALSTGARPTLTVFSGLGCMALFLALTAIFTATYIGKEPRALLPKDQA